MCVPVHGLSTTNHTQMIFKPARGDRSKGNLLPPKSREKLPNKAMHLSHRRNVIFFAERTKKPGDGVRQLCSTISIAITR